jgi:hypothetical protein
MVRRLDTVLRETPWLTPETRILLKADTQGFDMEVIRGCTSLLSQVHLIQTELAIIPVYGGAPAYIDVIGELRQLGYHLTGIYTVARDSLNRLVECDGIFRRAERNSVLST